MTAKGISSVFPTGNVDSTKSAILKMAWYNTMLSQNLDPNNEGLNGFVLRFLMQTASKEDYRAIEGLTTSMS